jgi:hypothetical protein
VKIENAECVRPSRGNDQTRVRAPERIPDENIVNYRPHHFSSWAVLPIAGALTTANLAEGTERRPRRRRDNEYDPI